MIVSYGLRKLEWQTTIEFNFQLESDDKYSSQSLNAGGGSKINLVANNARFYFPFEMTLPHPDLLAMSALKIISPYIGSKVKFQSSVSRQFASLVKYIYPNIKSINESDLEPRKSTNQEKYAVSFSGGADSLAAANLMPDGTPLILLCRKYHPEIGKFESWYRTDGNISVLENMSSKKYVRIPVYSDFEFLSVNENKNYCVYPDNYAFTIPAILLSEHLGLSGIFTGDMSAAFTNSERNVFSEANFGKQQCYYRSVGLDIDSAIKGVSEIGTEIINRHFNNAEMANTCQYGGFRSPCMKCVKCFRKSLIRAYLSGTKLSEVELSKFDQSRSVKSLLMQSRIPFPYTIRLVLDDYDLHNFETLQKIKNIVKDYPKYDQQLTSITMDPYQGKNLNKTMQHCLRELDKVFVNKNRFHFNEMNL